MTTYLVTGGGGFIGSNIVERLVGEGHHVRVIDNFSTGREKNLAAFMDKIELVRGTITSEQDLDKALDGVEFVLHQGAIPSVPRSVEDPLTSNDVNINGTLLLLHKAKEHGVKRVVFASSSSVYGLAKTLPVHEELLPSPISPYAVNKITGEYYCRVFTHIYGLETVCLRYFNVFGPRQDPKSQYAAVIPKFITCMLTGERPPVFGDGEQSRDFTYVANVVEANIRAAHAEKAPGQVMNIACGDRFTLNQMIATLNKILGTDIEPLYLDPRPGDIRHSQADITRAQEIIGYSPVVTFEEGLARTVAWYREQLGV